MKKTLKALALAAAATFAAGAAMAVPVAITTNQTYSANAGSGVPPSLSPGETSSFEFVALKDLRIRDFFGITGSGSSSTVLGNVKFGYNGPDSTFTQYIPLGATTIGIGSLPGFVLFAGQTFTFEFVNNNPAGPNNSVSAGFSFETAPVPVPAAGLLLLTALAGGAAVARRKKKKSA